MEEKRRVKQTLLQAAIPSIFLFIFGVLPTLILAMKEISNVFDALGSAW